MKTNEYVASAVSPLVDNWHSINWAKVNRYVRKLQQRIYRAEQLKQTRKVRKLQRLLLRSKANLLLSIKRVTQENKGKRTAGIDGYISNTPQERVELYNKLKMYSTRNIKVKPAKRTYIPKKKGKKRPLGIPVIVDRVYQNIFKNALEPQWEVKFEMTSYGFRPKRSAHDAMSDLFLKLSRGSAKGWIFEGDFEGCFDNLNHEFIMGRINNFPHNDIVKAWLKSGYIDNDTFHKTDKGTPQGGIISPLLANIALHGMEDEIGVRYFNTTRQGYTLYQSSVGVVRYADDFVIVCPTEEQARGMYEKLQPYLDRRGLKLAEEKIRVVHINEGFDFLGFNFRQYPTKDGDKLFIKPSLESVKNAKKKINEVFDWGKGRETVHLIEKLNRVLQGVANYWSPTVAKSIFRDIDSYVNGKVIIYLKHRHHRTSFRKLMKMYFKPDITGVSKDKWLLTCPKENSKQLIRMSWTKIERHVKIKQYNSPFDATLKAYFDKRDEKFFDRENTNAKRKLAKKSKYKCRICGESLQGTELIESNHIVPVVIGGVDSYDNFELLHKSCHKTHHVLLEKYGEGKKLPRVVSYLESNGVRDVKTKKAINLMKKAFKKFRY
ncbi:group II intron reverse transcriptase/maturase [Niallia sp. FSL R7-0271]|uniref:group II intron reverse transcriptase/maturase n=1 Tax=Niallia sp. FSL R7-0271 TaxID=2921678 RepID=UPI0030F6D28D